MDRLKAYDANYTKVMFDGPMPEQVQAQERLMQRVMDENSELKSKFELLQNEEKEQFEEIKKKLGLEYQIHQILKAKANTKENSYVKLYVEAEERSQTLKKVNQGVNEKFKNMVKEQEQSTVSLQHFQAKCEKQIKMLEQKYDDLQNSYSKVKSKIVTKVKDEQKDTSDELTRMLIHGQVLIEEKAHLIHGLKDQLKKTSEHSNKVTELKEMGKREAEMQYKMIVNEKQAEYKHDMKNIKEQYEHLLTAKTEEQSKFMTEANAYTVQKK